MKFKTLTILSILVFANYATAQTDLIFKASFEFVSRLNDTGIIWGGDYPSGNNVGCTSNIASPQDCNTGRDVTHNDDSDGHAGFSFTKLDASGVPLVDQSVNYATTPWSCVQDNVTGLVWEIKTPSTDVGGIHNQGNIYKWGGLTAIGLGHPDLEGTYYNDWNELVNGSNAGNGLCGFNDWRVPTVAELSSIVNKGTFNPAIDTDYFPNTEPIWFWSSTPLASSGNFAWIVYFDDGIEDDKHRSIDGRVRLVRSLGL